MVLRYLISKFLNNPQIIDKLADSYPIRRAAKFTAYAILKTKIAAEEALESDIAKRANKFQDTVSKEIKEGLKESNKKFSDKSE